MKTGSLREPSRRTSNDKLKKNLTSVEKTPDFSQFHKSRFLSPGQDDMMLESFEDPSMVDQGFEDDLPRLDSNTMKPDLWEISEEQESKLGSLRYKDSSLMDEIEESKRKII